MTKISFVVIGKNQEKTIGSCIESINITIKKLCLKNFEIIYVDSKSTDSTIEIIKNKFPYQVKIISLVGKINASIGRNIGAKESTGDVLFFIDGDMCIESSFLEKVYNEQNGLSYDIVSGKLKDILYNKNWSKIGAIEDRYFINKTTNVNGLGGIFLIKRSLFDSVNGFNVKYRIQEDIDYGLRLIKNGYELVRIPFNIADHHTVDYYNFDRVFSRIKRGDKLYSGILFRDHFLSKSALKLFLKLEKFTLILILSIVLSFKINLAFLLIYPIIIGIRFLKLRNVNYFELLFGRLLDNVMFIIGLFFFVKVEEDEVKYFTHD